MNFLNIAAVTFLCTLLIESCVMPLLYFRLVKPEHRKNIEDFFGTKNLHRYWVLMLVCDATFMALIIATIRIVLSDGWAVAAVACYALSWITAFKMTNWSMGVLFGNKSTPTCA